MRILLYGINFSPELTGIGKYSGEMATWLAQRGHDVHVITSVPYYPQWKIHSGYKNWWSIEFLSLQANPKVKKKVGFLKVYRCPLWIPSKPRGLKRILHSASFAMSSLPLFILQWKWRPEIIFVVEPPLFCAPSALIFSKLMGSKSWLHIQDFEVDAAFQLGIIKGRILKKLASLVDLWLMRHFDMVSTISNSMLKRLTNQNIKNLSFFPNWASLSYFDIELSGCEPLHKKYGFDFRKILCLYSGNISTKQGLDGLMDVASQLPDFQFIICGDGVYRKVLMKKFEGISNILFLPLQPIEKFTEFLKAADIHLIMQKKGMSDLVMPSKLTNILAIGGVAVVTAEPDSELGLLSVGLNPCVYRCDPEDANQLREALIFLRDNPAIRTKLALAARDYALKNLEISHVLYKYEKSMNELISPP